MKRVSFSIPWFFSAEQTAEVLSTLFHLSVVALVVTYVVEAVHPEFVSVVWSLDIFLWSTVIVGLLLVAISSVVRLSPPHHYPAWYRWLMLLVTTGLAGVIIFSRISEGGMMRWFVTVLAMLVVAILCIAIATDEE